MTTREMRIKRMTPSNPGKSKLHLRRNKEHPRKIKEYPRRNKVHLRRNKVHPRKVSNATRNGISVC